MINLKILNLFILLVSIVPSIISQNPYCNQTCPGNILNNIPYAFGFSSGCEIQLNCTQNGTVLIEEFAVQKVTNDDILVSLPAECGRAVEALHRLYGNHYAPTSNNAILMENCTERVRTCSVPDTMIQPNLDIDCDKKGDDFGNVSCYSDNMNNMFLDYENVTKTGCRSLLSAMVVRIVEDNNKAVSLNVQMVKLGWWLKGGCQCSDDAICTEVVSPMDGSDGYRCRCKDGYDGDGYKASSGCRKAISTSSSGCSPSQFLFGHCDGSQRAGVLVGIIVIVAPLIAIVWLSYCYIQHRTIAKSRGMSNRRLCQAKGITIPIYSYKEIEKATNRFSDKQKLGTGAYGTVYKGKIRKGEWVAIKRIKHIYDGDDIDQVMNEIILLSTVSHPNLVRLLGCSFEKNDQILIYEFMPNGTLLEHLQKERGNGLPWPVRLTIASEIAQAIAHLHSMKPPIYHRDVKSCNILLDYNFKTKVADFGLSRLGIAESSHISTAPRGTPGYLDPEYHQNFHLTDKSDVYSFGVVLVEIITALKAVDFSRRHSEVNLASLAVDRIGKGNLEEIIDPFLKPIEDVSTMNSIRKVAEVAFRCLAFDSDMRPPMVEVASELEKIKASNFAS